MIWFQNWFWQEQSCLLLVSLLALSRHVCQRTSDIFIGSKRKKAAPEGAAFFFIILVFVPGFYFIVTAFDSVLKFLFIPKLMAERPAISETAIKADMRPYSIATEPLSLLKHDLTRVIGVFIELLRIFRLSIEVFFLFFSVSLVLSCTY